MDQRGSHLGPLQDHLLHCLLKKGHQQDAWRRDAGSKKAGDSRGSPVTQIPGTQHPYPTPAGRHFFLQTSCMETCAPALASSG